MKDATSELLSPAGDFETALAAFDAGADAIYCGLNEFSARAYAQNFTFDELKAIIAVAHSKGKKVYVTFNTLVDEDRLEDAIRTLSELSDTNVDALIIQDIGIAAICRKYFPNLELHASTQLVAHNLEGVLALGELGFRRVVLARELSVSEIESIAKRCGNIELECFIHGALCYSISGLCLFSAMEKGRSGNRGACAYCCRNKYENSRGESTYSFSMKDLRLGEDVRKLITSGVTSLKIEGRMKSDLYVASVTKYYRNIIDGAAQTVGTSDLETVFSRRTTELYLNGKNDDVIDTTSIGHLGTPVGIVKKVTRDREGRRWMRLHTLRELEKHDGLQFAAKDGEKAPGFGIGEMRKTISRIPVFEVAAGTDVEIELPEDFEVRSGETVYCSMSNEMKRKFPKPSYRPSDYAGPNGITLTITLAKDGIRVVEHTFGVDFTVNAELQAAKNPDRTFEAIEKAFSKLGGSDYSLKGIDLSDADKLFAPMSLINDVRRDLIEKLDSVRFGVRNRRMQSAIDEDRSGSDEFEQRRTIKLRSGQALPKGDWSEIVYEPDYASARVEVPDFGTTPVRIAVPVYTAEPDFNKLRNCVKALIRAGFDKWEASDLATLRMLKALGIVDIAADWSLYTFNSAALKTLRELGVKSFVASPENNRENLQYLAESGYDVEFLEQQSTPLFISKTKPGENVALRTYLKDGLYITTKSVPRTFDVPKGASSRIDLSWSAE